LLNWILILTFKLNAVKECCIRLGIVKFVEDYDKDKDVLREIVNDICT